MVNKDEYIACIVELNNYGCVWGLLTGQLATRPQHGVEVYGDKFTITCPIPVQQFLFPFPITNYMSIPFLWDFHIGQTGKRNCHFSCRCNGQVQCWLIYLHIELRYGHCDVNALRLNIIIIIMWHIARRPNHVIVVRLRLHSMCPSYVNITDDLISAE